MLFFLALSCVDYDFTEWELVDVFHQAAVEELDLLIVMDNSASMEPYQAQLGQHFNAFISYFDVADVDYHIALITTDTVRSDRGIFLGEVIDPETPDPEAAFSTMINVGSGGSGTEMGLEAARLALTEPLASTENVGFLRPDAFKTVVIVSDEDDASPDPVHVYVNDLVAASGGGRMDFNASTVTVTDVDSCDEDKHLSHAGTRYIAAVDETGGVSGNICDTDFEAVATEISKNASRLMDTFYLSSTPKLDTMQLSVNDEIRPCEEGTWVFGWRTYRGVEHPAIIFSHDALPPVSAKITVRYNSGGGGEEGTCTEASP